MPILGERFGHRTWNATKLILKQLTNVNRTDSLEPGASSIFDLHKDPKFERDQTHIKHLLRDTQYTNARSYIKDSEYKVALDEMPRSITCLDSLQTYLDARENALSKSENGVEEPPPLNQKTTVLKERFNTLKTDIQYAQTHQEPIGLFSLVNQLFEVNEGVKEILEKQLEEDLHTLTQNPTLDPSTRSKMTTALKTNHETAFKVFEDTMTAEIKAELNKARFENSRLALIKLWQEKGSAEMKKQLEEAIRKSIIEEPNLVTLTARGTNKDKKSKPDYEKAFREIKEFKTLSGLKVTQSKPGSFHIQFPGRYNVFYHNDLQDNVAADLKLLALSVKASGSTEITFELNGKNTDEIHLIARKAYEAAIAEGFKGGKDGAIHFKVNGKVMKLFDELDKDNKTTKGVFSDEHEIEQYHKENVEAKMRALEKADQWFESASKAEEVKDGLREMRTEHPELEISGAENNDRNDFTVSGNQQDDIIIEGDSHLTL